MLVTCRCQLRTTDWQEIADQFPVPSGTRSVVEGIREILEYSDVEKEIRIMFEQSKIPNSLVEIAISDPGNLDEMEKEAGGYSVTGPPMYSSKPESSVIPALFLSSHEKIIGFRYGVN